MTFAAQTLHSKPGVYREGGAGGGPTQATWLILLSSLPFQEMISGDPALPRLSLKIIFNTIDDIHRGQASLTSPRKDDLCGQREEHSNNL